MLTRRRQFSFKMNVFLSQIAAYKKLKDVMILKIISLTILENISKF